MTYDVRYRINDEEFSDQVEAKTAAEAADSVRHRHSSDESFELIQVQMLDDSAESSDNA